MQEKLLILVWSNTLDTGTEPGRQEESQMPRMNPRALIKLCIAASLLLLSTHNPRDAVAADQAGDQKIKVAFEGGFPPFNYVDSSGQLQGFDVDIAKALCERAGLSCGLVVQEWTGMIPNLLSNKYDMIVSSMSMSAERRELVTFSDKYYDSPSVFIARRDSGLTTISDETLKGLRVGIAAETSQQAYIKAFFPSAETTVFRSSPELYKALANEDVDIMLEDKLAVYDWLTNTNEGRCCKFVGTDIKDNKIFGEGAGIAFRKGDTALAAKINAALAEIQAGETYDSINAKYFPFSIR
jgi:polar amino acid transport system substrate-binding protein